MTTVSYTALRSLLPGHSADTVYGLELRLISAARRRDIRKSENRALGGAVESLFWNSRTSLSLTIGSYPEQSLEYDAVVEFLDSVERGEGFTFDRYGSSAAPHNAVSAVMPGTYQVQRHVRKPGEGNDLMRFTFMVELV